MNFLQWVTGPFAQFFSYLRTPEGADTTAGIGSSVSGAGGVVVVAQAANQVPPTGGLAIMLAGLVTTAMPFIAKSFESWARAREADVKAAEAKVVATEAEMARLELEHQAKVKRLMKRLGIKRRWMMAAVAKCPNLVLPPTFDVPLDEDIDPDHPSDDGAFSPPSPDDTQDHIRPA